MESIVILVIIVILIAGVSNSGSGNKQKSKQKGKQKDYFKQRKGFCTNCGIQAHGTNTTTTLCQNCGSVVYLS